MKLSIPKLAGLLLLSVAASVSVAQDAARAYPNHAIKLVVPFPAGSLVDALGRSIADSLQASLKQPVVIDNKAGASTLLGAKQVATAPPDGYTLLIPTVTTMSLAPQLTAKPGIDPLKELTPIARLGATNFFLTVHPSFPARTMGEWIAEVRKNPVRVVSLRIEPAVMLVVKLTAVPPLVAETLIEVVEGTVTT